VRDRSSFMQRMKGWKRELWDALTSVDRHVKKTAEEDHRELSDGEKKHSVKEFKQSYMPTREAARAVLDPRYAGHCLGTDMNKLACEGLLSEAPTVLKVHPPPPSREPLCSHYHHHGRTDGRTD
jgi:hypothetical protein